MSLVKEAVQKLCPSFQLLSRYMYCVALSRPHHRTVDCVYTVSEGSAANTPSYGDAGLEVPGYTGGQGVCMRCL
jgi:hypothetical protein